MHNFDRKHVLIALLVCSLGSFFYGTRSVIASGIQALATVAAGGTGLTTLTAHAVLLGEGTSPVAFAGPGTSGQCLVSNGASSDPTYQTCNGTSVSSTTPVTVNANSTMDQNLMSLSLPAGFLNSTTRPFMFDGAGVFTTQVGQTPTLTFKIKLCTVSGCGSGTVVTLVSIVTTATVASITNNNWNIRAIGYTAATGATGNLEIHGPVTVDLGALTTTADAVFGDTNTAVSSNIDLTAALFVQFTITFSTNAATANIGTQRAGGVMPWDATTAAGGTNGFTILSDQTLAGAAASVTFSAIPGTYKALELVIQAACSSATTNQGVGVAINGDAGNNYSRQFVITNNAASSAGQNNGTTSAAASPLVVMCASGFTNGSGIGTMIIPNYANTVFIKQANVRGTYFSNNTLISFTDLSLSWVWNSTAAITSIVLTPADASNFIIGSRFSLYGLN